MSSEKMRQLIESIDNNQKLILKEDDNAENIEADDDDEFEDDDIEANWLKELEEYYIDAYNKLYTDIENLSIHIQEQIQQIASNYIDDEAIEIIDAMNEYKNLSGEENFKNSLEEIKTEWRGTIRHVVADMIQNALTQQY